MHIRMGRRVAAIMATVTAGLALALTAAALAGSFSYTLFDVSPNTWVYRDVDHDYSYIQGYVSPSVTTCVQRNSTGNSYCAQGTTSHSYPDSCNPAACKARYSHTWTINKDISAYDEWR
jgi:hypothetical protein